MFPSLRGILLGRSTRSGHVFSPYSAEPFAVPGIDIYDFINREEEHRATRELDEGLVELEPIPISAIDLDLDLELPPLQPVIHVASPKPKRRATPSASSILAGKHPAQIPRVPTPPAASNTPILSSTSSSLPTGDTIRIPRIPPSNSTPKSRKRSSHHKALRIDHSAPRIPPSTSSTLPTGDTIRIPRIPPSNGTHKSRKSAYHKALRVKNRIALPGSRKSVTKKHVQKAIPIFTSVDISHLSTTSTVWLGMRVRNPPIRQYTLAELREEHGMDYLAWDGWSCRPLLDAKNRVFALLAGRPKPDEHGYDSYADVIATATELFAREGVNATGDGRRGPFVAVTVGNSFGGGQKRPGNLLNNHINTIICATMLGNWAIKRLAGFANGMFQSFAPALHSFYTEQRGLLYLAAPWLRRIFLDSVSIFSACTFNFGPSTVTLPHVDAANLAWGWCAITALGYFNPDLGGHLILWDLKLIIRFPPGSTILIPSALLRHSNVSIQQGETRYSFTQYTAGGLFRWVYNGGRSDIDFYRSATPEQVNQRESDRAQRWEDGVKMFMVWNPQTGAFENDVEQ